MGNFVWKLNTSNSGKFEEFKRFFAHYDCALEVTHHDLKEIHADPLTVVTHKASQMENDILVDDTSLEIEGADVGVNVRWLLDHLNKYVGCKAFWRVLLAFRRDSQVFIYEGILEGSIVQPEGVGGFGFDSVFLPKGAIQTLAQAKPDQYNARAFAVTALIEENVLAVKPVIENWNGSWQSLD